MQAVAFKNETITKDQIKYMAGVPSESIVDIEGLVEKPEKPIESCTQKVEIKILKFFVVNRATNQLPLQIEDASKKVVGKEYDYQAEEEEKEEQPPKEGEAKEIRVKLKTRLDNRVIDLRTTAKQAIFRLSSAVCQLFREFLDKNGFIEIHTPKLIGGTSEGGANVFRLKYFGKEACLAQSPQLYKQMCIMADFDRVYEIAPVFRAENSFTHRHMCEFIGLDVEMAIKEHYYELLDFLGDMFVHIFEGLETRFGKELKAINEQFEFEPFRCKKPALKLTYAEGIELLKENGIEWSVHEDLSTKVEKQLGDIGTSLINHSSQEIRHGLLHAAPIPEGGATFLHDALPRRPELHLLLRLLHEGGGDHIGRPAYPRPNNPGAASKGVRHRPQHHPRLHQLVPVRRLPARRLRRRAGAGGDAVLRTGRREERVYVPQRPQENHPMISIRHNFRCRLLMGRRDPRRPSGRNSRSTFAGCMGFVKVVGLGLCGARRSASTGTG